jgi:exopolysaccharide biosynthesis polyprenyl glycosylphosphotransferase
VGGLGSTAEGYCSDAALESAAEHGDQELRRARTMRPSGPVGSPRLRRLLVAFDLVALGSGWLAALLVVVVRGDVPFGVAGLTMMTLALLTGGVFILSSSGLYRRRLCASRSMELTRIARSSFVVGLAAGLLLLGAGSELAVLAGLSAGTVSFTALVVERGVFREWIRGRRANGDFGAPVVVVAGSDQGARELSSFLTDNQVLGLHVGGVVTPMRPDARTNSIPWLGTLDKAVESAAMTGASGVVVDASSVTGAQLREVIDAASAASLHVHVSSGLRRIDDRRITVSLLADEAYLHIAPMSLTRGQVVAKRLVDVTLGGLALLMLAPVLLVCGAAIWLQDRGPVLFRQERVGKDGERFTLYKLRTMVLEAEQLRAELESDNRRDGPLFKLEKDPRVTRVGRFLRASSLDEAPQLLNVLEGTMSLVGPRPALPAEAAVFDEQLRRRMRVKPGMTGLWQVEARDLSSFDLYRRFDLHYVENWSFTYDLALVGRTTVVVAMRTAQALIPARLRRRPASGLE